MTEVDALAGFIRTAPNLKALCDALNRLWSLCGDGADEQLVARGVDLFHLRRFGGPELPLEAAVWSWDATRVLVGDGGDFRLMDRVDYYDLIEWVPVGSKG